MRLGGVALEQQHVKASPRFVAVSTSPDVHSGVLALESAIHASRAPGFILV